MKTRSEILNMSLDELKGHYQYEASLDLPRENTNTNCTDCVDCTGCTDCKNCLCCKGCMDCVDCTDCANCMACKGCVACRNCYLCHNSNSLEWAICNVEVGKDAYLKKLKELRVLK